MKFFCATLSHETNRFSPIPTSLESYREFYLYLPSTGEGEHFIHAPMEGVNLYQCIRERGHDVICGLAASAQPSAPTNRRDYESLREELLGNLKSAGDIDGVLLFMHGAQVAEGYDDCEGDVLARIRSVVGPEVPIAVELDLHANVTDKMVDCADVLLACKEYPHWDFPDRAAQMLKLMEAMVTRQISPAVALARVPMLGTYYTTAQPMRAFVDELYAMEEVGEVLAVSVCHGFAMADIAQAGASVVVVGNRGKEQAQIVADQLAVRLFDMRKQIATHFRSTEQALDEAVSVIRSGSAKSGPVIIADVADNPGGGAPGDSTFLLEAILARGMADVAVGMICDPQAVSLAARAGVGARIPLRIGGKMGPTSGRPLDVVAEVSSVRDDAFQIAQSMKCPLGPAVAISVEGVDVVLYTHRNQTFTPQCFTDLGIDPASKRLLVVKSQQHFYEHFSAMASHVIYAMSPGTVDMSLTSVPFKNVQRPAWPLDPVPIYRFGKTWG